MSADFRHYKLSAPPPPQTTSIFGHLQHVPKKIELQLPSFLQNCPGPSEKSLKINFVDLNKNVKI